MRVLRQTYLSFYLRRGGAEIESNTFPIFERFYPFLVNKISWFAPKFLCPILDREYYRHDNTNTHYVAVPVAVYPAVHAMPHSTCQHRLAE